MKSFANTFRVRSTRFRRGDSVVAWTGLALLVLLLGSIAGAAWWAKEGVERAEARAWHARADATLGLMEEAGATLLETGELTAFRKLVVSAADSGQVRSLLVTLGDGRVIASSDPSSVRFEDPPSGRWPSVPADAGSEHTRVLQIAGRGSVLFEVDPGDVAPVRAELDGLAGVAVFGGLVLGGFLLIYRRMRRGFAAVGAVRDAVLLAASGEKNNDALRVDPSLGGAARAWNNLLDDREELRRRVTKDRAGEQLGSRRERRGELTDACDALWQGMLVVDEHGTIRYANGAASVFLRADRAKLAGARLSDVVGDETVTEAMREVAGGLVRTKKSIEVERVDENDPSASGVLRLGIRPLRREDGAGALVMIEDITQLRVAEQARHSFVAQATHELRTPLTNIRLYVEEALELDENEVAERSRCLNVINQETRRLERVVSDMLSVSEIEAGSLRLNDGEVRLDQLFSDVSEDFVAQAQSKKIHLAFDLPPKLPAIKGDRDKLAMVLHNLVGNALKYTPEGGEVTVRVEVTPGELVVEVRDNGIGIAEGDLERVFEKFYRAKDGRVKNITGTGLGLSLAREMARLHGGDIEAQSEVDKGSTFTLRVPVKAGVAVQAA